MLHNPLTDPAADKFIAFWQFEKKPDNRPKPFNLLEQETVS